MMSPAEIHRHRTLRDPFFQKYPLYRQWFMTIAQGGSFI